MSGMCELIKKDLYQVLECSPESTNEELKQAYHRKILESHPDKTKNSSECVHTFHEVKLAWEVLGNLELRKEYDVRRKQADLEANSAVIYARLKPSELETSEDEEILTYPCRCGNNYLVQKTDLKETDCLMHVPCQDCTFVIVIET